VAVDWRQAVALTDPACREAVKAHLAAFLRRHDFDGVTLAGLHFGSDGPEKPELMSPAGEAACRDFVRQHGFDLRDLWRQESPHYWRTASADLERFMAGGARGPRRSTASSSP